MSKASKLFILKQNGFNIPEFIFTKDQNYRLTFKADRYIIRSSFSAEDSDKSFAGIFRSYGPVKEHEIKLNGFPGALLKPVMDTIKDDHLLKMLSGEENRSACIKSVLAYYDPVSKSKKLLPSCETAYLYLFSSLFVKLANLYFFLSNRINSTF